MPTLISKLALFLLLPTLAGLLGLYTAYLAQYSEPNRKLAIEKDFGMPFTLTLLLVVVIGFQTRGFSTNKVQPMVQWPKVKRTRKVIHKHVVKNEEGNDDDGEEKEEAKKNK